jgi:hypothetical protein
MDNDKNDIYVRYLRQFPNTLSAFYMDTENIGLMAPILVKMEKALKDNKPIDDSIFLLPDDARY